jgi:hypothetical protein
MGFGLVIGFIEHLQIVTTSNYSVIVNSHIRQFTTELRLLSLLCLHNASSAIDPSISVFMFLLAGDYLTTN